MLIVCGRPYTKAAAPVSATGDPGAAQVEAGEHKPMACREVDGLHVHVEGDQLSRQHTYQFASPLLEIRMHVLDLTCADI